MPKRRKWSIAQLSEKSEPVREALAKESNRGAALIGAAYLDDILEALLRCVFVDQCADELLGINQPLGTFHARICLAYSVGLLSKHEYQDLEIVRGIRNDFAHLHDDLTFDNESVKARCENLQYGCLAKALRDPRGITTTSKDRFVISVAALGQVLVATAKSSRRAVAGQEFYQGQGLWKHRLGL